jgi:membrane complex biogenesis BtpA family protein
VLNGVMYTDQGPIVGRAADVLRLRRAIAADVAIVADVFVKHAVPPANLTLEDATRDLAGRGGADVLVVSGSATGDAPDLERLERVKNAAGATPVFIGSGATSSNVGAMLGVADGCIVGTSLKRDGRVTNPVDAELAAGFVAAAG